MVLPPAQVVLLLHTRCVTADGVACADSWSRVDDLGPPLHRGRLQHTLTAVDAHLYVVGGFDGVALGDVLAYQPAPNLCATQTHGTSCVQGAQCGWCQRAMHGNGSVTSGGAFPAPPSQTVSVLTQFTKHAGERVGEPEPARVMLVDDGQVILDRVVVDPWNSTTWTAATPTSSLAAHVNASNSTIAVAIVRASERCARVCVDMVDCASFAMAYDNASGAVVFADAGVAVSMPVVCSFFRYPRACLPRVGACHWLCRLPIT